LEIRIIAFFKEPDPLVLVVLGITIVDLPVVKGVDPFLLLQEETFLLILYFKDAPVRILRPGLFFLIVMILGCMLIFYAIIKLFNEFTKIVTQIVFRI